MFKTVVVIAVFFLPLFAMVNAQQKRAVYGPVVKAYLTGLDEELTELEFQFKHQEINRTIYERTRQRLAIIRRYVERRAALEREDRVPELQVLADDELSILKAPFELNPDDLNAGDDVGGRWKVVGIERSRVRFFVLEKLPPVDASGVVAERKLGPEINPLDVIETIIVREKEPEPIQAQHQPEIVPSVQPTLQTDPKTSVEPGSSEAAKTRTQNLRLLHIYLPEYTSKAREKKIEGELIVRALFQRDGKIRKARIERGLGYGLDERAIEAVKRLGFLPAEYDGQAVDASAQIVFGFKLEKVTIYVGAAELEMGEKP